MRGIMLVLLAIWSTWSVTLPAKEAAPLIEDPVIRVRMAHLTEKLRCLVCQGQSVADSHSDFSNDIRREVQRLMEEGKTDLEVIAFLVERYGDFILYEPPVKESTILLWAGPFVLLLLGGGILVFVLIKRSRRPVDTLTAEEIAAAERLLSDSDKQDRSS